MKERKQSTKDISKYSVVANGVKITDVENVFRPSFDTSPYWMFITFDGRVFYATGNVTVEERF